MDMHAPATRNTPTSQDNQFFLEMLFDTDWTRATIVTVPFESSSSWTAWPADPHAVKLRPDHSNYYCVSILTDPRRRDKAHFLAMHVLMLDDVGPKGDPDKILAALGEPLYRLETSPGNEQWGYRLVPPVTDATRAERLQTRVVEHLYGGKDPGEKGTVRLARLPVGTNNKKILPVPFPHVLRLGAFRHHPSAEMVEASLPLPDDSRFAVGPSPGPVIEADEDEPQAPFQLTLPRGRPAKDPALRALRILGMIKGARRQSSGGEGWDITCPWHGEHSPTGAVDTGTFYFRGGGFKCWHGHCDGKGPGDVRKRLDELLREDSGGLAGLDDLEDPGSKFDEVDPATVPASPVQTTPDPPVVQKFKRDVVYLTQEDKWLVLNTDETLIDKALDTVWSDRLHGHRPIDAKGREIRPSTWARSICRRVAERTWWPGKPRIFEDPKNPERVLVNTWRDIERPLARVPWAELEAYVRASEWWILVHAVCGTHPEGLENARRLVNYMAMVPGAPDVKPGHNPLFMGPQGVGKDQIWTPLMRVLGDDRAISVSQSEFNSTFEGWVMHRLVTMAEIRRTTRGTATDHDQYQIIKRVCDVGREFLHVNRKYQQPTAVVNVFVLVMTSNEDRPMTLPDDDRRVWVIRAAKTGWTLSRHQGLAVWLDEPSPWGATNNHAIVEFLTRYWDDGLMRAEVQGHAPMTADKQALIQLGRRVIV